MTAQKEWFKSVYSSNKTNEILANSSELAIEGTNGIVIKINDVKNETIKRYSM